MVTILQTEMALYKSKIIMKNKQKTFGFTLIELLVVIAIIGLLAGLLFPAVASSLTTAKKAKARTIAQSIETAIMVYTQEYNGRLPIASGSTADNQITEVTVNGNSGNEVVSKEILSVLMNIGTGNSNHPLNHRGIVFLETEVPTDDGTLLDPWGSQFQIILDGDRNGRIKYLTENNEDHRKKAVVVSAGKNRKMGNSSSKNDNNDDNIANVELPLID